MIILKYFPNFETDVLTGKQQKLIDQFEAKKVPQCSINWQIDT